MSLPVIDPRMAAQSAYSEDPTQKKLQLDAVRKSIAGGANKEKQLREACQGFESIFLQKMWEQMRNNVPKEGYLHSREEEIYQSMFDTELAKKMSSAGGIGLADMLYEQLNQKLGQASRGTSISMINKDHTIKPLDTEQGGIPLKPNYGALLQKPEVMSAEASEQMVEGNKVAGLYNKAVEPGLESASATPAAGAASESNNSSTKPAPATVTAGAPEAGKVVQTAAAGNAEQGNAAQVNAEQINAGQPGFNADKTGSAPFSPQANPQANPQAAGNTPGSGLNNAGVAGAATSEGIRANSEPMLVRFAPQNKEISGGAQAASAPKAEPVLIDIPGFSGMKKPFAQPFSEPVASMPMFDTVETVIPYRRQAAPAADGAGKTVASSPAATGIGIPEGDVTPLSKPAPTKIQEFGQNLSQDSGQGSSQSSAPASGPSSGPASGLNGGGNIPAGMFKTFDKIPSSI